MMFPHMRAIFDGSVHRVSSSVALIAYDGRRGSETRTGAHATPNSRHRLSGNKPHPLWSIGKKYTTPQVQPLLRSKANSNSRCVCLSSSMKRPCKQIHVRVYVLVDQHTCIHGIFIHTYTHHTSTTWIQACIHACTLSPLPLTPTPPTHT